MRPKEPSDIFSLQGGGTLRQREQSARPVHQHRPGYSKGSSAWIINRISQKRAAFTASSPKLHKHKRLFDRFAKISLRDRPAYDFTRRRRARQRPRFGLFSVFVIEPGGLRFCQRFLSFRRGALDGSVDSLIVWHVWPFRFLGNNACSLTRGVERQNL